MFFITVQSMDYLAKLRKRNFTLFSFSRTCHSASTMPEADRLSHVLKWQANNAERMQALAEREKVATRKYARERAIYRRATEPRFKLEQNLRTRISAFLKGKGKSVFSRAVLGCSLVEFQAHLEKQFQRGMNWLNYGAGWHIDHKKPVAAFNVEVLEELLACFHYTNYQPLWKTDNLRKNSFYEGHMIRRFDFEKMLKRPTFAEKRKIDLGQI